MNAYEFIHALERYYGKTLPSETRAEYYERLARFPEDQLPRIYDACLDTYKFLPRWAEIRTCTEGLGLLSKQPRTTKGHSWEPSDCRWCGGSGRVYVWYRDGVETARTPAQDAALLEADPGDYSGVALCGCSAGAASTLQQGIPRLKGIPKTS